MWYYKQLDVFYKVPAVVPYLDTVKYFHTLQTHSRQYNNSKNITRQFIECDIKSNYF